MAAVTRVRGVVPPLRFAAADVAAVGADPQVEPAAALFAVLRARFGNVLRDMSALGLGSGEELHVDLAETSSTGSMEATARERP
jgi:hypothetical protein